MKKLFFFVIAVFLTAICVCYFDFCAVKPNSDKNNSNLKNEALISAKKLTEGIIKADMQSDDADTEANSANVTKYVLKYYNGNVILICRDADNIISETQVPDINFNYLTETDKKLLNEGIKLDSIEDVYKIIEDYSS